MPCKITIIQYIKPEVTYYVAKIYLLHITEARTKFFEKSFDCTAAQRAKNAEKVHKPSLAVNVINFELNGFNASIWFPWSPSEFKKL